VKHKKHSRALRGAGIVGIRYRRPRISAKGMPDIEPKDYDDDEGLHFS
jgi:hypothetical protein